MRTYSGGMRRKLDLGASLVGAPRLLLLDEPTTGLDPRGRSEMLGLVGKIAASQGRNVILSSHLLPDVESICKYVVILDGGHQIAAGPLDQLLTGAQDRLRIDLRGDREAFLQALQEAGVDAEAGTSGVHVARKPGVELEVFRAAKAAHAEVRYMGTEIRSLEELFLDVVERHGRGE